MFKYDKIRYQKGLDTFETAYKNAKLPMGTLGTLAQRKLEHGFQADFFQFSEIYDR